MANYNAQTTTKSQDDAKEDRLEARKRLEREIDFLGNEIKRYRIDGQRFFAGDLPLPPEELGEAIHRKLRQIQSSPHATSAAKFRLGSLEAQFNSHKELFGRRLREREEGEARVTAARPELEHDPRRGVVLGGKGSDGAVEALYKGLYLQGGSRNPSMELDRFRQHLQKQAAAIRAKTGCQEIQFRVTEEDGKKKIKAKPIKKAQP